MSSIDLKLVRAAGFAHLETGLSIAVHTGRGPGLKVLEAIEEVGAPASAFIWTHAQNAPIPDILEAAQKGAWISLDGLSENSAERHRTRVIALKQIDRLGRVLLSHDAGWYDVVNPDRAFRGYTFLTTHFREILNHSHVTEQEWNQLTQTNPARCFARATRGVSCGLNSLSDSGHG